MTRLRALTPQAFLAARLPALKRVEAFLQNHPDAQVVWLSDGLEDGDGKAFGEKLAALAPEAEVLRDPRPLRVLAAAANQPAAMEVAVRRSAAAGEGKGKIAAYDAKGASLGESDFTFDGLSATARIDLPIQLRNEISRLEILGENSAGGILLLDSGARRRRVGLVAGGGPEQTFLSPMHYLRDALLPFADLREAKPGDADPIGHLLDDGVDVLILADANVAAPELRQRLDAFLQSGGTILRFAGPRLAAGGDDFFPVELRARRTHARRRAVLGSPQALGAVRRGQPVLRPDAAGRGDGVAAGAGRARAGPRRQDLGAAGRRHAAGHGRTARAGRLILFHVAADTSWSNLPLRDFSSTC